VRDVEEPRRHAVVLRNRQRLEHVGLRSIAGSQASIVALLGGSLKCWASPGTPSPTRSAR
jgi:hypothetical protein